MRKPLTSKPGNQLPLAEMDPKAFEKAPATRGFFLDTVYSGTEEERLPGSFTLRAESGRWCVTLRDPSSFRQIFLSGPTLSDLWRLVESVIADEKAPWEKDRFAEERANVGRKKRT